MSERERMLALCDSIEANVEGLRAEIDGAFPVPPEPSLITVKVKPGDDVQAAYTSLLETGGIIKLAPGLHRPVTFSERPTDAKQITFTSDSTNLPDETTRITPEYAPALGILQQTAATSHAVRAKNKSRNVAFVNVGIAPPATKSYAHVELGGDKANMPTPADRPSGFVFDRVYVYGDPVLGAHRGITLNAVDLIVRKSWFDDIFEVGRDSQAVSAWNGGQHILLDDCFFGAGAENIMFGGSDSATPEMTCADIIIRDCTLAKNFAWMSLAAQPSIKALFEIKNVKRLLMERCLLERNWARDWPDGVAIILKACNGQNIEEWATCEDVTLRDIIVRDVGSVLSMVGKNDSSRVSDWMRRVSISNLLAYDIDTGDYQGTGRGCPFQKGAEDCFVLDHITMHTNNHSWMNMDLDPAIAAQSPGTLVVTNSVLAEDDYGYYSADNGCGFPAATKDWTATEITGNVFKIGERSQGTVPPNNLRLSAADWEASFDANHQILPGSPAAAVVTTDGTLPGAHFATLPMRMATTRNSEPVG